MVGVVPTPRREDGGERQGSRGGLVQRGWGPLCYTIRSIPLAPQDSALDSVLTWPCFLRQGLLVLNPELWRNARDPPFKLPVLSLF